jgi:hypothetical protein
VNTFIHAFADDARAVGALQFNPATGTLTHRNDGAGQENGLIGELDGLLIDSGDGGRLGDSGRLAERLTGGSGETHAGQKAGEYKRSD